MNSIWNRNKFSFTTVAAISATVLLSFVALTSYAQVKAERSVVDIPGQGPIAEPQGAAYVAPPKLSPKIALVTIYRPAVDPAKGVVHLEINGVYHTSLQSGGYSEVCVLPREFALAGNLVQANRVSDSGKKVSLTFKTKAAQNFYIRVNGGRDDLAVLTPVSTEVAQAELKESRRQIHVATRIANPSECNDFDALRKIEPRVLKSENVPLASDIVFEFGKSDIKGISPEGRNALEQLATELQHQYGNLEKKRINIVGYSDPLGSVDANRHHSVARAQNIRTYLVNSGLSAAKLSAEGRGDTELVVTTCNKVVNPENIECNKPNRRVVVWVQTLDR